MSGPLVWQTAALGAGLFVLVACTSPTAPDPFGEPPPGTHQSSLFAVVGTGTGGTSVTSIPNAGGGFAGTMRFRVRAKPNTTYFVQRAADLGQPADRVCQRADGLPPWSPADPPFGPTFVTFPRPLDPVGPLLTLTTDSQGEGSRDYEFDTPQIRSGTQFDLRMRLVDDENAPTSDLRSGCMTIVVN